MISQKASSGPCVAVYFSVSPKSHKALTFLVPHFGLKPSCVVNKGMPTTKELLRKTPPELLPVVLVGDTTNPIANN